MKKYIYFILTALMVSCGTPKEILKYSQDAQLMAKEENYAEALHKSEKIINYYESKNKGASDTTYAYAGKYALYAEHYGKAVNYLKTALEAGNKMPETLLNLAKAYKGVDNLSYEISTLESFADSYPEDSSVFEAKKMLMLAYLESDNLEKAELLWPQINAKKNKDKDLLESYVVLQNRRNNSAEAIAAAKRLLIVDAKNKDALYTVGKYYFDKAENRYQTEMKAYEKKKTRRQYAYLLDQLKLSTEDFKTSRFYFEQLYRLHPEKDFAAYLANINLRLNNKKKADYYKSLSK